MNDIITGLDDIWPLTIPRPKDEPEYDIRAVFAYREEHGLSAEEMTPELLAPFIIDRSY